MKLTHDKVRSLRDVQARALHGCECQGNCICCGWATTAVALADEWLARRTVRWDGDTLHGPTLCGEVAGWNGTGYGAAVYGSDGIAVDRSTEAEARAWLEAKAREAGLEVAR